MHLVLQLPHISFLLHILLIKLPPQLVNLLQKSLLPAQCISRARLFISLEAIVLFLELVQLGLHLALRIPQVGIFVSLFSEQGVGQFQIACELIDFSFKVVLDVLKPILVQFCLFGFSQKLGALLLEEFMLIDNWLKLAFYFLAKNLCISSVYIAFNQDQLVLQLVVFKYQILIGLLQLMGIL